MPGEWNYSLSNSNWGNEVYCKKCGYENDDDASFCENCGASLNPYSSQKPSGMSNVNKLLIVVVIALIAIVGISVGILLTSKAPVANNTTNNTSVAVSEPVTTPTTTADSNSPKLIDSGNTSGTDSTDGHFTFEWKTFEVNENELIIYSTYSTASRTVKQTNTLKKYDDMRVEIIVEPKASGKSSYDTVTTMFWASTVVDYYWNHLRSNVLMKGPIR